MLNADLKRKKMLVEWRIEKLTDMADMMNWYRESGEQKFLDRAKELGKFSDMLKKRIETIK